MVVEIQLADDEDVIRVYVRFKKKTRDFGVINQSDFARVMQKGNGISIWRLQYCTRQQAIDGLPVDDRYKIKGTLIIKAGLLKAEGMRFVGKSDIDAHIAARCAGCDMNLSTEVRCKKMDGSECALNIEQEESLSALLATDDFFKIDQIVELY